MAAILECQIAKNQNSFIQETFCWININQWIMVLGVSRHFHVYMLFLLLLLFLLLFIFLLTAYGGH